VYLKINVISEKLKYIIILSLFYCECVTKLLKTTRIIKYPSDKKTPRFQQQTPVVTVHRNIHPYRASLQNIAQCYLFTSSSVLEVKIPIQN